MRRTVQVTLLVVERHAQDARREEKRGEDKRRREGEKGYAGKGCCHNTHHNRASYHCPITDTSIASIPCRYVPAQATRTGTGRRRSCQNRTSCSIHRHTINIKESMKGKTPTPAPQTAQQHRFTRSSAFCALSFVSF